MSEGKGNKVGFLSSSYRPKQGTTSAMSKVWSETLDKEASLYCHPIKGHEPTSDDMTGKNTYLSFCSKGPVRVPDDYPAGMTLYDRIQKSRDTMVNQYCNKCRQDRYFCRHRSEFANPDPKQTYKVPLVSSMKIGWLPPIDHLEKPVAPSSLLQPSQPSSSSSDSSLSPSKAIAAVGSKSPAPAPKK